VVARSVRCWGLRLVESVVPRLVAEAFALRALPAPRMLQNWPRYEGGCLRGIRPKHPSEVVKLRCIDFYDAANARPFDWEFRQGREILPVKPSARLMVSDVGAMLSACEAAVGIAQIMALGSGHLLAEGKLIDLFPNWPGEVFPLYALYPSRQLRAAKVRTFIDFTSDLLVNSTSV
jgi:DNA-binding transcriptional LysR family regulator